MSMFDSKLLGENIKTENGFNLAETLKAFKKNGILYRKTIPEFIDIMN